MGREARVERGFVDEAMKSQPFTRGAPTPLHFKLSLLSESSRNVHDSRTEGAGPRFPMTRESSWIER